MKIAITGASGFLGSVLLPLLLAEGHTLQLLTRSTQQPGNKQINYIRGDMLQAESLALLVAGADAVIHLAAQISIDDRTDEMAYRVNTTGTQLLLTAAQHAGVRRFIHISSVTAFNQAPYDEPLNESRGLSPVPVHNYDSSKAASQALVLDYNATDFEVIVLAPTAVVGPMDGKPSLLGKAIINIYKGRIPMLFPGGVDFVDVRDVAGAIVYALSGGTPGNAYLLSGKWASLKELSEQIGAAKGKNISLAILPLWAVNAGLPVVKLWSRITGGPPYYTRQAVNNLVYSNKKIDHSLATKELHFHPRPFAETIRDTVEWFRQQGFLK